MQGAAFPEGVLEVGDPAEVEFGAQVAGVGDEALDRDGGGASHQGRGCIREVDGRDVIVGGAEAGADGLEGV